MRRPDTKTKDTIGLQGHQDTNNEGHHERTPLDLRDIRSQTTKDSMRRQATTAKDAIGLQGHQDTHKQGHHETSGHENEGCHRTSGTSGHN